MKRTKRLLAMILTMSVLFTTGCGGSSDTGSTADTSGGTTTTTPSGDSGSTGASGDQIEIELVSWQFGNDGDDNMERAMIAKYMEKNPNVTVTVTVPPEGENQDSLLASRAATGDLPDVFDWGNNVDLVTQGWAADLTEFTSADPEWANVVDPLIPGTTYGDKVFLLPRKMNLMGMFINKDIYAENNLQPLEFGYSMDELMNAIEKTTTATTKGTSNYFPVDQFYPIVASEGDMGFATYDYGTQEFNFNSDEYARGIEYSIEVYEKNWDLRNTSTEEFFGRAGWEFGEIGGIGNQFDGTWWFETEKPITVDYVGLPNGYSGVLTNDYLAIAATSDVKEAAFDFVKFMTYSTEGIKTRLDLQDEFPDKYKFSGIPVIAGADASIDERFLAPYEGEYPGFIAAYGAINETAVFEGNKEIPGLNAGLYDVETGVQGVDGEGNTVSYKMWQLREEVMSGRQSLSDHADTMTALGNEALKTARDRLEAAIG